MLAGCVLLATAGCSTLGPRSLTRERGSYNVALQRTNDEQMLLNLMLVSAAFDLMQRLELSETTFGMTVLALAVSIEELARELQAAARGHPEITFGNVVGSVLAFFLFNAGVIALVRPVTVGASVVTHYLPVCLGTVVLISALMMRRRVGRVAGMILLLAYAAFVAGA